MDSTPQVTSFQHRAEVDFLRQVMSTMKMSSSKVAMAQFTPWSRVEWSLANSTYPESRVQEAPYCPCDKDNCPSTSINTLTRYTMNSANRKSVPDVILVISNSYQPLVELPNEPLISPISPLHVFYVVIGSNMHVSRFEPSAHTVGIKVTDFEHLPHLVLPLCQSVNGYIKGRGKEHRRDSGIASPRSPRDVEVQVTPIPTPIDHQKEEEEDNESSGSSESVLSSGSDVTDSTEDDLEDLNRKTHLPRDHPARKLPPIDLMFLVDTSSSIGINNFDIQKNFICEILKDVDIAPGRSRISMVQYAQDPSVVFGFDQYYSFESVRRGVMRLSYTGGATMLSKALAFAGGIMYHEQNLKKTTKRHQFLPTPKHDRLQVLCLVSDGYSDDNADKESVNLHDRLHVKIFAVVTRSFNKDKLVPITRFDGSIFTVHQRESVAIWLWRQQRIWAEHYSSFIEKEKKRNEKRKN
uniref:VWFA domain-containing protein n=1 Tax=Caenorhabditis tropicalis TaxID=1561998 RepID=A0A1I7UMV9_9PELO